MDLKTIERQLYGKCRRDIKRNIKHNEMADTNVIPVAPQRS